MFFLNFGGMRGDNPTKEMQTLKKIDKFSIDFPDNELPQYGW